MKVSDEIRNWCEFEDGTECGGFVTKASFDKLCALADRIDREMVELPRDRDGVPIHVGDTVYLDEGLTAKVTRISIGIYEDGIYALVFGYNFSVSPEHVIHTRPDSFERIADELDEMVDAANSADDRCEKLADLADRIRKLAAKEQGDE